MLGIFHLAVTAYSLRKLQQLQAGVDRLAAQSMPSEALWSSLDTLQHGMTAQFSEVQKQLAIVIEQQGQILAAIQADQWDRLNAKFKQVLALHSLLLASGEQQLLDRPTPCICCRIMRAINCNV